METQYFSPGTVSHPRMFGFFFLSFFFTLAAIKPLCLIQLIGATVGAAGHASLPPPNQIRLSNMLLEYLIFFFLLAPVRVIKSCAVSNTFFAVCVMRLGTHLSYVFFFFFSN